jgi:hypothetical protein
MQRAPLLPRARWFLLAGAALMLAGLVWGVIVSPLPYQDPTPEQYARQILQLEIYSLLLLGGAALVLAGLVLKVFRAVRRA